MQRTLPSTQGSNGAPSECRQVVVADGRGSMNGFGVVVFNTRHIDLSVPGLETAIS